MRWNHRSKQEPYDGRSFRWKAFYISGTIGKPLNNFSRWVNNRTFRKLLRLLCGERTGRRWQRKPEPSKDTRTVPVWAGDWGNKFTNLGLFWRQNQMVLEKDNENEGPRWLPSFSQLIRWSEWRTETGKPGEQPDWEEKTNPKSSWPLSLQKGRCLEGQGYSFLRHYLPLPLTDANSG